MSTAARSAARSRSSCSCCGECAPGLPGGCWLAWPDNVVRTNRIATPALTHTHTTHAHATIRAPDSCGTRPKMMYASTKDFFKGFLDGIGAELQANEPSELGEDEMRERVESTMTRK